ncbi:MAG: hypothetical protein FJZ16_02710 [Candidatus Omnitrophica bacterium]|nr:hypothetical protein [Candidatus Omnitrophota bacterium]
MDFKKLIFLIILLITISIIFTKDDTLLSESEDFQKNINDRLGTIITKQEEIIKTLSEIKEELRIVRVRVSSR